MKYISLLSLLLLVAACQKTDKKTDVAPAAAKTGLVVSAVEGYTVKPSVLTENVTTSGSILAAEETELHPESSGRVVRLNLPEGRSVRKGELLLKIFDEDLKSQLRKLETQIKQAEITEQRLADLLKVKGVSQQEYDLAVLQTQTLRSEMELTKINIDKTELRAPYDGIIGLRNISPGAYVTPATAVTVLRSATALKLDFSVPEKYSRLLRSGQTVTFKVEGSAADYTAVVQATEQSIQADSRNLRVRALVRNGKGLLPGSFAEVNLALGEKQKALLIPNQAVIPQARDKKVIVSKGGKAQFVTIKTGVRQAGMIEITEGLQIGDTICTTGILFLRPGSAVTFSKVD
ncbi:MAG: efflux RND transporter periplasmic adaptor subunit [Lewinellaceae bacterium]|mgnify:CR=1 FL=1|jgi:membrane fusion protein (multidrug efflux system)|nr:efflux RND transporter periplasmic adaptor subunit [Lewinellaceae bacterium]